MITECCIVLLLYDDCVLFCCHMKHNYADHPEEEQGWEYARTPSSPYHPVREMLDLIGRRRWIRKLKAIDDRKPCVFYFQHKQGMFEQVSGTLVLWTIHSVWRRALLQPPCMACETSRNSAVLLHYHQVLPCFLQAELYDYQQTPRMYLSFHGEGVCTPAHACEYQLRAHLYEGRNIYAGDRTGLSGLMVSHYLL